LVLTSFEFHPGNWCQKTGFNELSCGVVCKILRLAILVQYQFVTERQTTQGHNLFHRRTRRAYLYYGCLAWYNVVLTARWLKREIQTTAAKC